MAWLPDGEKFRFDATHERDRHRQTDRQTDRRRRPRLCIASRGKNDVPVLYRENWPKSTAVITVVIFTCPGRAGPVFSLDRRRKKTVNHHEQPFHLRASSDLVKFNFDLFLLNCINQFVWIFVFLSCKFHLTNGRLTDRQTDRRHATRNAALQRSTT